MGDFATEAGHWYHADGRSAHEMPNASRGGMRPTRISDAKKHGLLPSVTTIMKLLDKPALDNWRVEQGIMAALTSPHVKRYEEGEITDKEFMRLLKEDADAQAREAAKKGTIIHGYIERYFRGESFPKEGKPYVDGVVKALWDADIDPDPRSWITEKAVTSSRGYAGKCDLASHIERVVGDYKTKDGDLENVKAHPENAMQLGAYANSDTLGLYPNCRAINIFISRTHRGVVKIHEWTPEQLKKGWEDFKATLECWKQIKGYWPERNAE